MLLPGVNTRGGYDVDDDEVNAGKRLLATVVLQKGPMTAQVTWPSAHALRPPLVIVSEK